MAIVAALNGNGYCGRICSEIYEQNKDGSDAGTVASFLLEINSAPKDLETVKPPTIYFCMAYHKEAIYVLRRLTCGSTVLLSGELKTHFIARKGLRIPRNTLIVRDIVDPSRTMYMLQDPPRLQDFLDDGSGYRLPEGVLAKAEDVSFDGSE